MPKSEQRININGRVVIPGCIDPHVHFREPGSTHKEDFKTGSLSAAFNGVTTVFDMPNNKPFIDSAKLLEEKRKIVSKKSFVDFGLFMGITNKNLGELARADAIAYKAFLGDKAIVTYATLQKVLLKLENKVVCVHAEDPLILAKNKKKFSVEKPESHTASRPAEAEATAVEKVLKMKFGKNKVHFCHVSTKKGLEKILKTKKASCETTPHHLFLSDESYAAQGNFLKTYPPVRAREESEMLWARIGEINCIASDHAPHTKEEKESKNPPGGVPGVETLLPLLINAANNRRLGWNELVRLTSHSAMEIFSLHKKGEITQGKDADLVVIDNAPEWTISADELHSKCNWTPYEGWKIKGRVEKVFLRGELIKDGAEFLGKSGFGEEIHSSL